MYQTLHDTQLKCTRFRFDASVRIFENYETKSIGNPFENILVNIIRNFFMDKQNT